MAYENVDVDRAKNAINNCLNSIKHTASSNMITDLPSNNNWVAESKSTFVGALDKLVNTRYSELETYLKKCLQTLDKISSYKSLQSQNATLNSQINSKTTEYNNTKYKYNKLDDKTTTEAKNLKSKMESLDREIRNLKSKRDDNAGDMSSLNNAINA